eukprot:1242594-Heterocapsa_arctica.AAC.1
MAVVDDTQTLQSILPRDEVALVDDASSVAEEGLTREPCAPWRRSAGHGARRPVPPDRDQSGLASLSGAHFAFGPGEGLASSADGGVSVAGTQVGALCPTEEAAESA